MRCLFIRWPQGKVINTNKIEAQRAFIEKLKKKKAKGDVLTVAQEKLLASSDVGYKAKTHKADNNVEKPKIFSRITFNAKKESNVDTKIYIKTTKSTGNGNKRNYSGNDFKKQLKKNKGETIYVNMKSNANSHDNKGSNTNTGIAERLSKGLGCSR
uniref:Uncharacterized protein n=1 Tax=Aplanochytrium stocchinoi TaxID=215587 RepID=A0A7S3PNW8_9STRA|mmetsp:Transcript_139/g.225  ORF Transcript_139/g.225 Transcript_139/m.225 type:complete len:156 (-) Transcript_139:23-490(-)